MIKRILLIVLNCFMVGYLSAGTMTIVYGLNPVSFSSFATGKQIYPAEISIQPISSGFFSDNVWNVDSTSDSHYLNRFGFMYDAYGEHIYGLFRADLKLDFKFEYFQTRLDGGVGYIFRPMDFLSLGLMGDLYYNYMGNSLLFSAQADVTYQQGDSNSLYLISDISDPTKPQYRIATFGPHIVGISGGVIASLSIIPIITIRGRYLLLIGETTALSNTAINTTNGPKTSIPVQGFSVKPSEIDVEAIIKLKDLNIDFIPVVVGYRIQNYPTIGAIEKGIYFGVTFLS